MAESLGAEKEQERGIASDSILFFNLPRGRAAEVLTFTLTSQVIGTLQIPITIRILGQSSASILIAISSFGISLKFVVQPWQMSIYVNLLRLHV